jgi:hypothetical protein
VVSGQILKNSLVFDEMPNGSFGLYQKEGKKDRTPEADDTEIGDG